MKRLGLLVVCLGMLAGCTPFRNADPLTGTEWTLVEINASAPLEDTTVSMLFKDGKVSGSGGCNRYFGVYQFKGEAISFKDMGMTEMACMPLEVMNQEQEFHTALLRIAKIQLSAGKLFLIDNDGNALLGFEPKRKD